MKRAKIAAVMVICVIAFTIYPPQAGHSQFNTDTVLSPENQVLFKIRDELVDSINAKTTRTMEKLNKLDVKKGKGRTMIYIHDTVYLPFWKSLFHFKNKKR